MRQIITTHAGDPFGRMDPVSLYRPADGFQRIDLFSMSANIYLLESIPGEKYPRKQIRWSVHTIGSIR